jgi:hypothetical protein
VCAAIEPRARLFRVEVRLPVDAVPPSSPLATAELVFGLRAPVASRLSPSLRAG